MDKNIAALLREDAQTIDVVFHADDALEAHLSDNLVWPAGADRSVVDEAKRQIVSKQSPAFRLRPGVKKYTYVAPKAWGIKSGDNVLVEAAGTMKVVKVVAVHSKVQIKPNDEIQYGWVVAKIDQGAYTEQLKRNVDIEAAVSAAYQRNLQKSFRHQILEGLEGEDREGVLALLNGPDTLKG